MSDRLQGRVAIVTGAGRGIGRGEAMLLAAEGAKVVVNDLGGGQDGDAADAGSGPADAVVQEIRDAGGDAVANYESVADMAGAERIVQAALDSFDRLDILVNNAGILRDRMIYNIPEDEWDRVVGVHLKGHFACIRFASQIFRQQRWGRIVNTSSEAGLGSMGQASYGAAKEGIAGLTRTVAKDLGRYNVTCNAIRPRAATRMTLNPELKAASERMAELRKKPGQFATPEQEAFLLLSGGPSADLYRAENVAPMVVWLCTEQAKHINGRTFLVGGDQIGLFTEPIVEAALFHEEGWTVDAIDAAMPNSFLARDMNPQLIDE